MDLTADTFLALIEALGIGLLIGIERERSITQPGTGASAGVRTFAVASLIGAISMIAGDLVLLAVSVVVVSGARVVSVALQGGTSTGLTTTLALISVVLLGALATEETMLAAGIAVIIACLLATREALQNFSRTVLTAAELRDGLILGVSVLVILPILPDVNVGPGSVLNPQEIFVIVVLVMAIGAAGHIATRVVGVRYGLPLSGFLSGFVSSTATIVALGQHACEKPDDAKSAAAGATLSSVSSLAQIGFILLVLSPTMFAAGLPLLLFAGIVAGIHGGAIVLLSFRRETPPSELELPSQVFSVKSAVVFALLVAAVMIVSAVLNDYFGSAALFASVGLAGLVSTNSAAVALASLVSVGKIAALEGVLPLAGALTANTIVRMGIALRTPQPDFRRTVLVGLTIQLLAFWIAWGLSEDLWDWLEGLASLPTFSGGG